MSFGRMEISLQIELYSHGRELWGIKRNVVRIFVMKDEKQIGNLESGEIHAKSTYNIHIADMDEILFC